MMNLGKIYLQRTPFRYTNSKYTRSARYPTGFGLNQFILSQRLVQFNFSLYKTDNFQRSYSSEHKRHSLKQQNINRYWKNVFKGETSGIPPHRLKQVTTTEQMRELINSIVFTKNEQSSVIKSLEVQEGCLIYGNFDNENKEKFVKILAHEFGYPIDKIIKSTGLFYQQSASKSPNEMYSMIKSVQSSLIPVYDEFFHKIHRMPDGFSFLVHLRGDILNFYAKEKTDIKLKCMSDYLKSKLQTWIIGTLDLKQITWNSPAHTIEKLGEYESVHSVRSLEDMKRRLGSSRRCFGFFHKNAPLEPLVFVWVALTKDITKNIKDILNTDSPYVDELTEANTAVFYSINSQPGVSGVDLGNFLIKRVVRIIQSELPNIRTFCTLSPMPGFSAWLNKWLLNQEDLEGNLSLDNEEEGKTLALNPGSVSWKDSLNKTLNSRGWVTDPKKSEILKPVMLKLGIKYLTQVKKPNSHYAADPVENFHLKNGASIHSINWFADTGYNGIRSSYTLMCNYNYILSNIELNNELYMRSGEIAISEMSDSFGNVHGIRHVS